MEVFRFFRVDWVAPPPPAGRRPAFLLESRASIGGGGVGAMGEWASIRGLRGRIGESVALRGWVAAKRSSGKIAFLQVRDGSGDRAGGGEPRPTSPRPPGRSSSGPPRSRRSRVTGIGASEDKRVAVRRRDRSSPTSRSTRLTVGLPDHPQGARHRVPDGAPPPLAALHRASAPRCACAARSSRRSATSSTSATSSCIDSPILTPAACEGTSTLFETDYFGDKAYLTQSGQLYLEPAAAAFGKVYCFGPTFRAEKSKTRRHLMEFWMVEPEVAFLEFDGPLRPRRGVRRLPRRRASSSAAAEELKVLERDTAQAREGVQPPFPRITYTEAIELLQREGRTRSSGATTSAATRRRWSPAQLRPAGDGHAASRRRSRRSTCSPTRRTRRSCSALDMLAPEGYGEIIGGSQRIHDHDLLLAAHPASTTCRSRRSSGTSTCASTAPSRTAASAWASSASSPGCAA